MELISILTLTAAISLGLVRVFAKLASGHIHPLVAVIIMQIAMLGAGAIAFFSFRPELPRLDISLQKGILFAVLAGLAAALFDILIYFAFKKGGDVSMLTTIVSGGSIVVAVIIGVLLLKESLTPVHAFAVLAIVVGIVLLLK